ncbi:MAG: Ig-like domain-containing protein, partial [Brevundimonas sp.]
VTVGLPDVPIAAPSLVLSVPYETAGTVQLQASGVVSGFVMDDQPENGTATLNGDVVTYTPATGYFGADTFTFRAQGPGGASALASVAVTVGLPDVPLAATSLALTVPFETAGTVQLQASGVVTGFALGGQPEHGTVTLTGGAVTYTPAAGYYGADAFGFVAQGPGGASAEALVSVTVGPPAVATVEDLSVTTPMDTAVKVELLQGALYVDGAEVGANPGNGTVTIEGTTATYTPHAGYFGTDQFTFRLVGPGGLSNEAKVSVTVEGGPPPEADALEKTGLSGDPIVFDVTAGLSEGPYTAVRLVSSGDISSADHGGSVHVEGLRVIFTPGAGWTGRTSFAFAVENRFGWSAPAIATAIVNPRPNTGPVIEVETWAGQPVTVDLLEKAQGGPFTGAAIVNVSNADAAELELLTPAANQYGLKITPKGVFNGQFEIRYT